MHNFQMERAYVCIPSQMTTAVWKRLFCVYFTGTVKDCLYTFAIVHILYEQKSIAEETLDTCRDSIVRKPECRAALRRVADCVKRAAFTHVQKLLLFFLMLLLSALLSLPTYITHSWIQFVLACSLGIFKWFWAM